VIQDPGEGAYDGPPHTWSSKTVPDLGLGLEKVWPWPQRPL